MLTFVGKEKIEQYGKVYNVDRFTLKSKDMTLPKDKRLDFNIWYDQKNFQIIRVSYSRMGNWEYRLKNFEIKLFTCNNHSFNHHSWRISCIFKF